MTAPDGVALAGKVALEVEPDSSGFYVKLRGQLATGADEVGREIGRKVAGPIAARISESVRSGVRDGGRTAGAAAAAAGDDYATAFGRAVRARLQVALRGMPDVVIDADSSPLDRRVAEIRGKLLALGNANIGVDVSDDEAIARVQALRDELSRLSREVEKLRAQGVHVDVDLDALKAFAELTGLKRELQALQRQHVNVTPTVNAGPAVSGLNSTGSAAQRAGRQISFLIAIGALIGPAIVPGAIAAAGAIGAIGIAAAGAVAAAGVAALGLNGIFGAVGELGKPTTGGGGGGGGGGDRGAQLANTIANAHDAEVSAARRVEDAERALARTQADARIAQTELTAARRDAARAAEDLAARVRDGAISEEQARIALERARANFSRFAAAGTPRTAAQQLDFDQAKVDLEAAQARLDELRTSNSRLADEKAQSDAAGIAGSKQVLAAQQNILDANERVRDAERDLADARREQAATERNNAFQIAQARASAAAAGGGAASSARREFDGLSAAGQRFALFLFSLKPQLDALRATAQAGLLPGVELGIRALLPIMPQILRFVGLVSAALGDFAHATLASLGDPIWQRFFGYLGRVAGPALQGTAKIVINVSQAFAHLLLAFAPVAEQIGAGLVGMSTKFFNWSRNIQSNRGFQDFVAFVQERGPEIIHTIGDVVGALVHIAAALNPIGLISVQSLGYLANIIQTIPTPVLTVLLGLILAIVAALKAQAVAQQVSSVASDVWAKAQDVGRAAAQAYQQSVTTAGTQTTRFGTAMTVARGAGAGLKAGLGALSGFMGGPLGIAIAAATFLLAKWVEKQQAAKARTDTFIQGLQAVADAYNAGGDAAVESLIRQDKAVADLAQNLAAYGVTARDIWAANEGDVTKQAQVLDGLNRQITNLQANIDLARASRLLGGKSDFDIPAAQEQIHTLQESVGQLTDRYNTGNEAVVKYRDVTDDAAQATGENTTKVNEHVKALQAQASELEAQFNPMVNLLNKQREAAQAQRDYNTAVDKYGASSSQAKDAGLKLATSIFSLNSAVAGAAGSFNGELTPAMIRTLKEGGATDAVIAGIAKQLRDAHKAGLAYDGNTYAATVELRAKLFADLIKNFGSDIFDQRAGERNPSKKARGGLIVGRGGPTDDLNLILASNREFVVKAASVAKFGVPFFEALNAGIVPSGLAGQTASRGIVASAQLFDSGGWLPEGITVARNDSGGPEPILSGQQWAMLQAATRGGDGPDDPYSHAGPLMNIENYHENGAPPDQVAADLDWRLRSRGGLR